MQNERIPKKALLRALLGIRSFAPTLFSVYSLSIRFTGKPPSSSLPLPAVSVLFVRISGQRDHSAPVLSRRHRIPVPVPGSPRYSVAVLRAAGQKDICHMRVTFVHTDAFHIHLFRLIAGVVPVNQAASSPDGNFRCILPVAKAFPGCFFDRRK